jgi:hypothetical protein
LEQRRGATPIRHQANTLRSRRSSPCSLAGSASSWNDRRDGGDVSADPAAGRRINVPTGLQFDRGADLFDGKLAAVGIPTGLRQRAGDVVDGVGGVGAVGGRDFRRAGRRWW